MRNSNLTLRVLALGTACAFLPLSVIAPVRAQDAAKQDTVKTDDKTPVEWKIKFKKGEIFKFRSTVKVNGEIPGMGAMEIGVKGISKHETKEVTDKGEGVVASNDESTEITLNGNPLPQMDDNSVVTQTLSAMGIVLKQKVENAPPNSPEALLKLGILTATNPVPDKPVKVGDEWKTEIDNPFVEGKKLTLVSNLIGREKVFGKETLRIKLKMLIPTTSDADEKTAIKGEETYNIEPTTGQIVRTTYTIENFPLDIGGGSFIVKMEGKTVQIIPGVNDKEEAVKKDGEKS